MRHQPADLAGVQSVGRVLQFADQFVEQLVARQVTFRSRTLEGEFRRHLAPAAALGADQHAVGHQHVVEKHLVEHLLAGHVSDRAHGDAGKRHVDQELRQAGVAVLGVGRAGAHQRDHVMRDVRLRGPDLGAVDAPAVRRVFGLGADRCQVGAGVGFAHADAEEAFAAGDRREDFLALLFGAEVEQQRAALAVGDPVRRDRRAGGQHLFQDDVALQRAPLAAAVLLGPGHADPALGAHQFAERRV